MGSIRKAPQEHAGNHKRLVGIGMDGDLWRSMPTRTGVYRWVRLSKFSDMPNTYSLNPIKDPFNPPTDGSVLVVSRRVSWLLQSFRDSSRILKPDRYGFFAVDHVETSRTYKMPTRRAAATARRSTLRRHKLY